MQGMSLGGPGAEARGGTARTGGVRRNIAEMLQHSKDRMSRMAERSVEPMTRPAHITSVVGTSGKPCKLVSNFFKVQSSTSWCLYEYRVDFTPEVDFLMFVYLFYARLYFVLT